MSKEYGLYRSGWMFTGAAVLPGGALLWVTARPVAAQPPPPASEPVATEPATGSVVGVTVADR